MPVKAPFRFARINRWIHTPAWGELVSHDVPFKDGLSGVATVRVTARTRLLVGGRRRAATRDVPGEVWPFQLPDGTWALPPSALQGLCRSILEIAAFGRLGDRIDDRRFGIRDLATTATAIQHYRNRLVKTQLMGGKEVAVPQTQAGWLIKREDGVFVMPCKLSRPSIDDLCTLRTLRLTDPITRQAPTAADWLWDGNRDARQSYEWFLGKRDRTGLEEKFRICAEKEYYHSSAGIYIRESYCHPAALLQQNDPAALTTGSIVLSGKPSVGRNGDRKGNGKKKREFVFHTPSRSELSDLGKSSKYDWLPVDPKVWDAFLYLHCDSKGVPKNPGWNFWAKDFEAGKPVPVFFWRDETGTSKVATLGMAFAFKSAYPLSSRDLLSHSHPDHLTPPDEAKPDLPHLIFGLAAEGDDGRGLKRRAWFGLGRCTAQRQPDTVSFTQNAVLLEPKPNYLGLYVRQRQATRGKIPTSEPMAAYARLQGKAEHLACPELAGVKIWPSSADRDGGITFTPPVDTNLQVQTKLNALPTGTVMEAPLTFHNLRPIELGALLWALSLNDPKAFGTTDDGPRLRHRLGMAKPYGLGEVVIDVLNLKIDDDDMTAATTCLEAFCNHMEREYPKANCWAKSPQVRALLKAANPALNRSDDLGYMSLGDPGGYIDNKKDGAFLDDYVDKAQDCELVRPKACNAAGGEAGQVTRPTPAGPAHVEGATQTTAQPAETGLALIVGARVRLNEGQRRDILKREGVIIRIESARHDSCTVNFGGRQLRLPPSLLVVTAHPPADT